jgi:hypothetical protein
MVEAPVSAASHSIIPFVPPWWLMSSLTWMVETPGLARGLPGEREGVGRIELHGVVARSSSGATPWRLHREGSIVIAARREADDVALGEGGIGELDRRRGLIVVGDRRPSRCRPRPPLVFRPLSVTVPTL